MKQVDIPELLDTDSGTAEEITNALLDIRDINRHFGGVSTMQSMVERVAKEVGRNSFTVLEVAAGAGYVPEAARQRLKRRGIQLQITLLDRAQSHLPEKTSEDSAFHNAIVGDALALPFPDSSFDLVDCSLFAHHLVADDLLKFVNEGLRVCRNAVCLARKADAQPPYYRVGRRACRARNWCRLPNAVPHAGQGYTGHEVRRNRAQHF